MKILFIGGTGRLSKDVAQYALDLNHEVFLFTRGTKDRAAFVNDKYQMIYGNIRNKSEAKEALKSYSFDVVIDFLTYNPQQLMDTLEILEGKYNQYIFISTATVYKRSNYDEPISEEKTEVGNQKWEYAYNKYLCENDLKSYFSNRDQSFTIIRPGVTYGNTRIPYPIVPGNTQREYSFLYRLKIGSPIPVFDGGETEITLTHTRDFARGVVALMGNEKAYGESFHIASNKTTTWGTVLNILEEIMGLKVNRLQLTQKEIYDVLPYYKEILLGDKGNTTKYDNSKICSVASGLSFDTDLKDGLSEMVRFYEEHSDFQVIDYYWMGCIDRLVSSYRGTPSKFPLKNKNEKIAYLRGRYPSVDSLFGALRRLRQ